MSYNDYANDWHSRGYSQAGGPPPYSQQYSDQQQQQQQNARPRQAYDSDSESQSRSSQENGREREVKQARTKEKERVRGNYGKVSLFMGVILVINGVFQMWKKKQNEGQSREMTEQDLRKERRRGRDEEQRRHGKRQYDDWRDGAGRQRLEAPYGSGDRGVRSIEAAPPGWDRQSGTSGSRANRSGRDRNRRG